MVYRHNLKRIRQGMLKTKSEVDKYVGKIYLRAKTENEVLALSKNVEFYFYFQRIFKRKIRRASKLLDFTLW